jgi:hypothetical protein
MMAVIRLFLSEQIAYPIASTAIYGEALRL